LETISHLTGKIKPQVKACDKMFLSKKSLNLGISNKTFAEGYIKLLFHSCRSRNPDV